MTSEVANRWWNTVANYGSNLNSPPNMPTPDRMSFICQDLSSVLFAHLPLTLSEKDFWRRAREIGGKITGITPFPDPIENFPLFVLYLYTFRELLNPKTVDHCMIYINLFCPPEPGDFFMSTFLFATQQPDLAILTFSKMHTESHKLWGKFLEQKGTVERFLDIYIPCLSIPTDSQAARNANFWFLMLSLSDLLTDLFLQHPDIVLRDHIAGEILKKLNKLLEYCPYEAGITILRLVIRLSKEYFVDCANEPLNVHLEKIFSVVNEMQNPDAKNIFISYAISYVPKFPVSKIVLMLVKQHELNDWQLSTMIRCSTFNDRDVLTIILSHLSRALIGSKVYMRASAKYLEEYFNINGDNEEIQSWFTNFISLAFMFIRLACLKNKYHKRVVAFLSVISTQTLCQFEWIYNSILDNASYACNKRTAIINKFFDVQHQTNAEWEKFLAKFKTLEGNQFKVFPFKGTTLQLVKTKPKKNIVEPLTPEIEALNIEHYFAQFLSFNDNVQRADQQKSMFDLEDFIDEEKERLIQCEENRSKIPAINITNFRGMHKSFLKALNAMMQKLENRIFNYQIAEIQRFIDVGTQIVEKMKAYPNLTLNVKKMVRSFDRKRTNEPKYKAMRNQRTIIKSCAARYFTFFARSGDYEPRSIVKEVQDVLYHFNSLKMNLPYTQFDLNFTEYFEENCSALLTKIMDKFNSNQYDECIMMINKSTEGLTKRIGLETNMAQCIFFISFTRMVFDKGYETLYKNFCFEQDKEFVHNCEQFIIKPVCEVGFSDGMIPSASPRMPLKMFFANIKRIGGFDVLSFHNNPYDLLVNIRKTIEAIYPAFKKMSSSCTYDENSNEERNDFVMFIASVIAINPPPNIISINMILAKWNAQCLMEAFEKEKSMFCSALQIIYPFDSSLYE